MTNQSKKAMTVGWTTVFKLFLLIGIVAISLVFIWYTLDVVGQLKKDAERMVTSYVRLWQLAASESSTGREVQVIFEEIITKANFPVVIADRQGEPVFWRNISGIVDNDPAPEARQKVKKLIAEMKEDKGEFPLMFEEQVISYFYYGDSRVIRQLQWMPFVEISIVVAFLLVGFIGFQNIRRSEQRHIWVGMAKEAAHQLGTPISSLMGWLELLLTGGVENSAGDKDSGPAREEIFGQMQTDVTRLQRVANRFGQIGSRPEHEENNVNQLLEETANYFKRRLPFDGQGVMIHFNPGNIPTVNLNGELFTWAIENLIKNSLQAVSSQTGEIVIATYLTRDEKYVAIDIKDNGPGIPMGIARKIFRPGFSTKKRGWGLGLTLTRRIIENYHRGQITLTRTQPGETLFRIILPVKSDDRVNNYWFKRWTKTNI